MRRILYIVIVIIMLSSCSTAKHITSEIIKEVPIVETKIEYRDRVIYDSLYVRDSIYMQIKADTVYKYVEKLNTRYIFKKDTICVRDSIPVPITIKETVTEIKEVNILHWWQKVLITVGAGFILAILIILGFKLSKMFI